MPVGLPRPLWRGLPVPFTVTLDDDGSGPGFRFLEPSRASVCQRDHHCLVCGEPTGERLCVAVSAEGEVIDQAPLHEECGRMTLRFCPHIGAADNGNRIMVGPRAAYLAARPDPRTGIVPVPEGFTPLDP